MELCHLDAKSTSALLKRMVRNNELLMEGVKNSAQYVVKSLKEGQKGPKRV